MDITNLKNEKINSRYAILEKVGQGSYGVVYRAKDESRQKDVALKFLMKREEKYPAMIKHFKNEYQRQLFASSHQNIVEAYDFDLWKEHFYFVSEFVDADDIYSACIGKTLGDKIKFFVKMLNGLDFLHSSGLLHLDIKAENVLVRRSDGEVKISDFGIAGFIGEKIALGGTPHYTAPEVALKQREKIDARADLFSAAVLMYYCLTGAFPYYKRWGAESFKDAAEIIKNEPPPTMLKSLNDEAPDYLETIIHRLLARNPDERFYANARAVINALSLKEAERFGGAGSKTRPFTLYLQPAGDRHIGRVQEQKTLKDAVDKLRSKESAQSSVFYLVGQHGIGKSHLLQKVYQWAEIHPESIYISKISFPADDTIIQGWEYKLQNELAENKRATLILVDNINECSSNQTRLHDIINGINERQAQSDLYKEIKPILLVLTSTILPKIVDRRDAVIFNLQPFTREEIEECLKSTPALKDKTIPLKRLDEIYQITNGIPLELAAYLRGIDANSQFSAFLNPEGKISVPSIEEASVDLGKGQEAPTPTRDRLSIQYNSLSRPEREVANFLAVWSFRHVTRQVTPEDVTNFFYNPSIHQVINNLVDKGVLTAGLVFNNPYMQTVVYEQLPPEDRKIIHDSIANYLKEDVEGILLHRGYGACHSSLSFPRKRESSAISLVKLAQKRIRERGDLTLAIGLLQDALSVIPAEAGISSRLSVYIQTLLIECCTNAGRYKEAEDIFNEALEAWNMEHGTPFPGMWTWKMQLYRKIIPAMIEHHKFDDADNTINEAEKLVRSKYTPTALTIKNYRGVCLRFQSQLGNAAMLEKAKMIFEETGRLEKNISRENVSRIQNNELGYILLALGNHTGATKALREKLVRHKKERNLLGEIGTAVVIANTYQLLKDYKAAEEFAGYAMKLAKVTKQGKWLFVAHHIMTDINHDSGKIKDALAEGNKCVAVSACLNEDSNSLIQLWTQLGDCHKISGDFDTAIVYLETAMKKGTAGYQLMRINNILGEVYFYKQDFKTALTYLKTAEKLLEKVPENLAAPFKERLSKFISNTEKQV